jgi:hypothetical protein
MKRCVEPEWLDELPPAHPHAAGSRRDLRLLNAWMGNAASVARALRSVSAAGEGRRLADFGTGDGMFLLQVARRLGPGWRGTEAILLDRQDTVAPGVREALAALDWRTEMVQMDVMEWLREPGCPLCDVIMANLFLHHFSEVQLAELLAQAAKRTRVFVAAEPRRSAVAFAASRLLWFIGCNGVTRHDAPISVRAGFAGRELAALWPPDESWRVEERPSGWAAHLFSARKQDFDT